MTIEEMKTAVEDAKVTLKRTDYLVEEMAKMIVGRLRASECSSTVLRDLKTELQKFNRHTLSWMD